MARPALSASRAIEVLDLFAAFPGRAFTMSEIVRAAAINVASCHALLTALTERGYLERRGKAYVLGRAPIALGQAAALGQPLVERAQAAAAALNRELGHPVLLSTLAGEGLLALTALPGADGRPASLRTGQRIPLIPPVGMHFLAWASDEAMAAWISRAKDASEAEVSGWRAALALTRRRGFQVTLRSRRSEGFADLMKAMAERAQPLNYHVQASHLIADHGWTFEQPQTITPDVLYDVGLIAAPLFDRNGHAMLSLGLSGFADPLDGAEVTALGERLMATNLRLMREERAGWTAPLEETF